MKTDNTNADGPFSELAYEFIWGFVFTSFLTYPFTMYLFPATWSEMSLGTGLSILACTWLVVTLMVQSSRDYLKRRVKQ